MGQFVTWPLQSKAAAAFKGNFGVYWLILFKFWLQVAFWQLFMIFYMAFKMKGQTKAAAAFKGNVGLSIWEALRSERRRARRARRCELLSMAMFEIPSLTPYPLVSTSWGVWSAQILTWGTPHQTLLGGETGMPFRSIALSSLLWHTLEKCPI